MKKNSLCSGLFLIFLLTFFQLFNSVQALELPESELRKLFKPLGSACFVILDLENDRAYKFNSKQCTKRLSPCSTFKIINSLIGLETGVIKDKDHILKWDGIKRNREELNKDHTLASAFQDSVVWYYQELAKSVGPKNMQHYLNAVNYGNCDIAGGIDQFWLCSSLKISADEQIIFLKNFYENKLPFAKKNIEIVKDISLYKKTEHSEIHAKTGSGLLNKNQGLGWFVGYITCKNSTYIFACNIIGKDNISGSKARESCLEILKLMGLYY